MYHHITLDDALPPRQRQRRLSLPSSFSPSNRRRSRQSLQPSLPPPSSSSFTPIPLACPPFMPMYRPSSVAGSAKLAKTPRRGSAGGEKDLWSTPASSSRLPAPSSPKLVQSSTNFRLKHRLHRWTGGQKELDFGCAGEWDEGPADLGDRYYDPSYPGGNRDSSASSVDVPSLTHSRGASTSSNFSVSTVASSVPPSPTLACHPEHGSSSNLLLSPYTSRVPLTPRTAQRKRQSDEEAAVDALNVYFNQQRLSQIEEAPSPRTSISSKTVRGSLSGPGRSAAQFETDKPVPTPPAGLAIFGAPNTEISYESHSAPATPARRNSLHPPAKQLHHARSVSHDLEIEFIETGHTTCTPLSHDLEGHQFPAAFLLPEDAFSFPEPRTSAIVDASPSTFSIFTANDSNDSHDSATTTGSNQTRGSCSTATTIMKHRSPIPDHDIGPALDELSQYFGATSSSSSSSSAYSCSTPSPTPPPAFTFPFRHQHHTSLPSLLPPAPISPLRKHVARFASNPPSPRMRSGSLSMPTTTPPTTRTHKRQSASFAAAQRARLVQNGMASPTLAERRVTYEWI